MFNRFPSPIQSELLFARITAAREGAAEIRPGHVLMGLMASPRTLVGRMLKAVPMEQARAALSSAPPLDVDAGRQDLPHSAETEQVLRRAAEEADAMSQTLTAEHLLLALFEHEACARVLHLAGLNGASLRESIARRAREPVRFDAGASPDTSLVLSPYDPSAHPEFSWLLTQQPFAGLAAQAAVLTNRSPQRVTALVARWTRTEADGVVKSSEVVVDDYFVYNAFKSLGPGQSVLLTPRGVTQPFQPGGCWAWAGPLHTGESAVIAVSLALDSVVFEDGRLAGEDTYDIARYLIERHEAAMALARQVLEAEQAGEAPAAVIARLTSGGGVSPDTHGWTWRLAMSARHSQEWLRRMPGLPAPPRLWRQPA